MTYKYKIDENDEVLAVSNMGITHSDWILKQLKPKDSDENDDDDDDNNKYCDKDYDNDYDDNNTENNIKYDNEGNFLKNVYAELQHITIMKLDI